VKQQRVQERREYSWKFPHDLRLRIRGAEDGELVISIESTGTDTATDATCRAEQACAAPRE
jgi:hypothetical protein